MKQQIKYMRVHNGMPLCLYLESAREYKLENLFFSWKDRSELRMNLLPRSSR